MNPKVKLPLLFFGAVVLTAFLFAKPVLACDPNKYSQWDTYSPNEAGKCGDTAGQPDCLDSATGKCWQPYTTKKDPVCPSNYVDPGFNFGGVLGTSGCKICCQIDPKPPSPGAQNCAWKAGAPPGVASIDCDYVKTWASGLKPEDQCGDSTDWHYIKDVNPPLGACLSVGPSSWSQNITDCRSATPGATPTKGVKTAIGCIPTSDLVGTGGFLMRWVFGAAGGIIILMLIITGYSLITSTGNPEKLQAVKENLVSIFSGLILIAFSLVLLKAVGANVLGIPGF